MCKYKRQRNFCVNLLRITKRNFRNLNEKKVSDNRTFWKEIKSYFNDKGCMSSQTTLVERDKIIHKDKEIAETMNKYFVNITKTLRLKRSKKYNTNDIDILTSQFKDHASIKKIELSYPEIVPDTFKFTLVSSEDVKKEIMNLNVKKSSSSKAIPATILKQSVHIYLPFLTNCINHSFVANKFPDELKLSEVIPLYKKLDPLKKENYRPVSLLPHVSKVFERIIYKQIMSYVTNLLSDYITGFRKSHGSQHCLVKMLENWKSALDKSESVCALFMDLSKAFDTINHDLLLAKLKAYGFSREALTLMCSYLKNRKQKVVINNSASTTQTVIAGVPQGSIDGPLLFNLFINDLVLFIEYTALGNYADDNNLSITGTNIENIKKLLLADFKTVIEWFSDNYMIINPDKCKYMCMGKNSYDNDTLSLNEFNLKNSDHEIILGITIDRKLTFNKHIKNLCKKAGQKLSALLRISPYLDENKKKLLYCSMIKSQFNYCPLVWMFCSRKSNNLINKVQERALRLITNDYQSSFNILLDKCNEF